VEMLDGKNRLLRRELIWKDNIEMDLKVIEREWRIDSYESR
jgi:hypothetical protein